MPTDAQIAGGHKANINNPNTGEDSKQHSKEVLDNQFNGGEIAGNADKPQGQKDEKYVAAGYKATTNNPSASEETKQAAEQKLQDMGAK